MAEDTITPDPNDQMVEPEFGGDELDAWLAQLGDQSVELPSMRPNAGTVAQQQQGGADDDNNDDDDGEDDDDDPQGSQTSTPTGDADHFVINGQSFPRADIERLYEFDQYMRANPDKARAINDVLTTPATPATASGEPTVPTTTPTANQVDEFKPPDPPEGFDLEDPQIAAMWDMQVTAHRTAWETQQQVRQLGNVVAQDKQKSIERQATLDMDAALTSFRQQYPGLNDDDIAAIRNEATPFVEGMMKQLPPVEALRRSMEVAAYANTDFRPKLDSPTPKPTNHQRSERRKQRLGAISGSPRSAPKVEGRPSYRSDRDMVNEFAHALADQMNTQ